MAYTVNKTNGAASVSQYIVQDSVLNSETDLKFVKSGTKVSTRLFLQTV